MIKKKTFPNDLAAPQDDFSVEALSQIKGSEKKSVTTAWIGATIFAFITWWFTGWGHMPIFLPHEKYSNPIACILGIIGLLVLGKAIYETIRLKRFGDPALELNAGKGVTGATLDGRINFGPAMIHAPEFTVKLACMQSVQQMGEKNPRIARLWSNEQKATLMHGGVLPISMMIPDDQPPSSGMDSFNRIYWQLTVKAPFWPVGFLEKYEVPIFAGNGKFSPATGFYGSTQSVASSQQASKWFILLFLIPAFIGGSILFYDGLNDIQRALTAQNWPTVTGRIVSSQIHYTGKHSSNYEPTIHYVYTVNDRVYAGSEIYPHWFWSRRTTQNALAEFPLGHTVPIHYAPDNPSRAILLPGWGSGIFQGLICGTLMLSIAGILATAFFAPAKDVIRQSNGISYRAGTWESKLSGSLFLGIIALGLLLWYVT